jgi:RNA-directed DNA polymerase
MQKRLVRSFEAKALAVRYVSDTVNQPGIDGVKWRTDAEKLRAVCSLDSKEYFAQPMRLLIVTPRGQTRQRHIQLPTCYDRAMQVLYAYSLDPVSESTGFRKSFAFRRGRSAQDVHAFIVKAFETPNPPKYIIKADVKACYASISHEWLLESIPMDARVLRQFLKAGHVFGGELFPPDDYGISIGSSISPILANMALDGMQQAIFDSLHGRSADIDYADGDLIRFADDIIVTARTKGSAEKILVILRSFLAARGLILSDTKTKIIDAADGFDFLSRHYQCGDGFVYAAPSEAAITKMENSMRELITNYRGGQKALIEKINKKLTGWASYHKVTEAAQAFRHIDTVVKTLLLELCETLNPSLTREKIIGKYFYREPCGEYVYALVDKPDVRVRRLVDTVLITHTPIATKKNPYIDIDYYEEKTNERAILNATGKYKPIWTRQNGRCYYCGKHILVDQRKVLVPMDPARTSGPKNLAYVHEYCSEGQAEFYQSDSSVDSLFDLYALLEKLTENNRKRHRSRLYEALAEYFKKRTEPVFTLTFKEIEKILGFPLCASARKYTSYWINRGGKKMSYAWLLNGYKVRNVNFEKAHVVFERDGEKADAIKIPSVFLTGRVPPNARAEFEILIDYICKKYAL